MNRDNNKSPEQLEREIAVTRAEMDHTLQAIQNRLSPDTLVHQAVDYMREGAGGYASNLGSTVKQNPVPFTLLGISLAWLMMSGRSGQRHDEFAEFREPSGPDAMDRVSSAMTNAGNKISDTVQSVKESAASVSGRVSDTIHGAGERARSAGEWAHAKGSGARISMGQWTHDARDRYYRARHGVETTFNDYPLVLGVLGVALGAAIGASLPSTRREDQLMGAMSDDFVNQTKNTVREEFDRNLDKLESAADKAVQAAKDEAAEQDLTETRATNVP